MALHVGELVERYSHNRDILFRIIEIKGDMAILFGEEIRLVADAPLADLVSIDQREHKNRVKRETETMERTYRLFQQDYVLMKQRHEHTSTGGYTSEVNYFQMPGRVLHIDGDPLYLRKCLDLYNKIGVPVQGIHCKETEMHEKVVDLIDHFRPDILVITGHDAYTKSKGVMGDLAAYRHSRHFVQAVREVRKKYPSLDQLVIFAGACQSHFEALIRAGANFASSPSRINIHALDPVYVVGKISFTSFMERVNVWDVVRNTITGEKGLGGIETRGILRTGLPFQHYDE
ncbi:sporulation peptidase YabG [Bacillus mycoides]|uniref:Spore coat assembly protein n=1 Tax=Bacillus mycoides TaxID=1405 RepID=A0A3D9TQ74_BACMY|nr:MULTISPECIES: sporulation peptidase YabG [Bacillus]MBW3491424.1 sporulation peptidase YabG [Bacillus sp. FDAARGOS_1420]RBP18448.1 spore coat assembly protein [Bacillus sp. DB-2]REF19256.1 spore coat assembly protein [Bacillus mycoides]